MIYFDNAATSFPKPERVYQAMDQCMREYAANPGRSGHQLSLRAGRGVYHTRELAAELFHIDNPLQIIFTGNATESLNLALKGLLNSGDHVITSSMEHNSVIRPLHALDRNGITFTVVSCGLDGSLNPEDVEKAITKDTRMVAITHASNVTGTLLPIEQIGEICRRNGLLFLVDASQTAGVCEIDVNKLEIDLLAVPGHKGLMGPQGTGLLYLREGLTLQPLKEGGTGSRSEETAQPYIMPDRYESGTLNTPGIAALGAGIEFVLEHTVQRIRAHESRLNDLLREELSKLDRVILYGPERSEHRTAVLSFNIEGMDASETSWLLDHDFDICTRSGLHCAPLAHRTMGTLQCGTVRLSPGFLNTDAEAEIVVGAIKSLTKIR